MNVLILYETKTKKGALTKISHCDKMIIDLDKNLIYYGPKRYDIILIDSFGYSFQPSINIINNIYKVDDKILIMSYTNQGNTTKLDYLEFDDKKFRKK